MQDASAGYAELPFPCPFPAAPTAERPRPFPQCRRGLGTQGVIFQPQLVLGVPGVNDGRRCSQWPRTVPLGPGWAGGTSGCRSPRWKQDHTYSPGPLVCCRLSSGTTNTAPADDSPISHFTSSPPPNPACPTAAGAQSTSLPLEPGTHGVQGTRGTPGHPDGLGSSSRTGKS